MTLQTVFLEIWLVVLAINGMILVVDALVDDSTVAPLKTPLSLTTNVTGTTQPAIFNNTDSSQTTLVSNLNATGGQQANATGGAGFSIFDATAVAINSVLFLIDLITGGFLWSALGVFGFPDIFIFVLQGVIGFLMALTIIYYFTGR